MPLPRPIAPRTVPAPEQSYKIKELSIDARIKEQVARLQVTQVFVNTGSTTMEVSFCFPLPYDGAVDQMTFMLDGKEYEAKLLPAKEAREIYLSHVRRNQDPALLEWIGSGMFQTSVFPVPPGAERKVSITLTQLLRKTDRLTDFLYPLSTARYTSQPVEDLSVTASIESGHKIKSVYSPTHLVTVQRPDDYRARVHYEAKNTVPTNDFRLMFDTADSELGASLISYRTNATEDGYFLLLASPEVKSSESSLPPKTVVFVVDRSGSMSGKKIDQAREALKFVLNNLRDGDLFNIVAYDSEVEAFRSELQRFEPSSRSEALSWVDSIYAGGSTNISGALTQALKLFQDPKRPGYIVFLTDGLPTAGETNEMKLAELVRHNNLHRSRLVCLGVGYDVNSRLLDRLSQDNFGVSEFVRPDESIEQHVSQLYSRISSPMLTDVKLSVELDSPLSDSAQVTNRVYPRRLMDLFAGQQLVVVGRYKFSGEAKVVISGSVGEANTRLDFPARLVESSPDQSFAFVESLWAMRRIGEIIDELDLAGTNQELINELVALSTKYGIVTPYTSFLADETSSLRQLADLEGNASLTRGLVADQLSQTEGQFAFEQRANKKSMRESNQVARSSGLSLGTMQSEQLGQRAAGVPIQTTPNSASMDPGRTAISDPIANTVQSIGNTTLFKRGKLWVADNAKEFDPERDQSKIQEIKRFSDAYFQLVAANTAQENAVLASQLVGEDLLLLLRGQCYLIR